MADQPYRKSLRLAGDDYRGGAYFVTVVTQRRLHLFGDVADGALVPNQLGLAVRDEWLRTASVRPGTDIDAFVVMPNHLHGIVWLPSDGEGGAGGSQPVDRLGRPLVSRTLGALVRGFKAASTRRVNIERDTPGSPLWQRNYHEQVIRNRAHLLQVRRYIFENPLRWASDPENLDAIPDAWERSFWRQIP